jgi:hypothetical protein
MTSTDSAAIILCRDMADQPYAEEMMPGEIIGGDGLFEPGDTVFGVGELGEVGCVARGGR